MRDSLYDQPEFYDLVSDTDLDMERFYIQASGGAGRTTLELACGTGRITLPLARSGADVIGGDLSETMLNSARQHAVKQGLSPVFVPLDMRDFDLGTRFDAVIVPANSLLHLTRTDEILSFLAAVGRHLKASGQLIFDIFVPSMHLLSMPTDQRHHLGDFPHTKLGVVSITETIVYDPITQVSLIDWYWSLPDKPDFRQTQMQMRQIFPQELPLLLERGGFKLVERFGDFDRSQLVPGSRRQVVIAALA